VNTENDTLQEELEKYCTQKEQFDKDVQEIKEKGEQDQIESQ